MSTAPLSSVLPSTTDLVSDSRSLDALKRDAHNDPRAAVKKAATQFEALFMQMVLKSMRDATLKSDLMSGGSGEEMATSMFDQQLAMKMASGGTGLAEVLTRQLTQHLPKESSATPNPTPNPTPSPTSSTAAPALAPQVRLDARVLRYAQTAQAGGASISLSPTHGNAAQHDFVQQHLASAQRAQSVTGVPADFIVSQAALESGWGKGEIRHADGSPSHNLFGIKAGAGWRGRTVDVVTTEYENGEAKKVTQKFRAYASYDEAFSDWAQLMRGNPRYGAVLQNGGSASGFAQALQQAGYATDPRYGEKLKAVMNSVLALRGAAVGVPPTVA